jgi:hypothetical protein
VSRWGDALYRLLPGSAPPDALRDPEVLARALAGAARRRAGFFAEALSACDRAQARRYIELDRIACSLQF